MKHRNLTRQLIILIGIIGNITATYSQTTLSNTVKLDTVPDCGCPKIPYVRPASAYYNALSSYIQNNTIFNISNWTLISPDFKSLFIEDNYINNPTIISGSSIKLMHPDKTFTLNIVPCGDINHYYKLPVQLYYKHEIKYDIRDFDFTKFDHTTLAYVHLLLELSNKRPDQMIRITLAEISRYGKGFIEMNRIINNMNEQYQTGIPLVTEETIQDSTVISGIMDSLVSKKLRQENVLTTAFVSSAPGIHKANPIEESRLYSIFNSYCGFESFSKEEKKIRPYANLYLTTNRTNIEISSAVIKPTGKKPNENSTSTVIWGDVNSLVYSSDDGLEMVLNSVCIPASVITGTHIEINFNNASLLATPNQNAGQLNYSWYPQFAINKLPHTAKTEYSSTLNNFTGLYIKEAYLKLPSVKTEFRLTASNLIINNFLIAGCIALKLTPAKSHSVLVTTTNGTSQVVPIAQFLLLLKNSGMSDIVTNTSNGQLFIYFKKQSK